MKSRWTRVFLALMMILIGAVYMLNETGIVNIDLVSVYIWAIIFGGLSAFFFVTYFLEGVQNWHWLFPASIFVGIAVILGLEGTALGNILTGAPVLAGIAFPFVVVFFLEPKKNWWALIPAWVMTAIMFIVLFEQRMNDDFVGAFVLFSIALPFFIVFFLNTKKNWWAIIPSCVMAAISLVVFFERRMDGNFVGTLILFGIALPFLLIYLLDRTRRWALIPFAALCVVALIPLMAGLFSEDILGFAIMFLFAIAFFVVYFWSKSNWWALIPAGVFTTIGLIVMLDYLSVPLFSFNAYQFSTVGPALMLAGFAATFGVLWLQRAVHPTDWAKYPALSLLVLAVLALFVDINTEVIGPIFMIVAGGLILLVSLLRKKK